MEKKLDIITIGESLVELSANSSLTAVSSLDKYYGGDTLTTAIAALRLGAKVGFISRIGMDCFRNYLLESWQAEGLDISQVKPADGANGIYIVSKLENGQKTEFAFYRKKTAATMLSIDDISSDYIKNASIIYSTGITQSLSLSAREAVLKAFKIAKENNLITAYDPNFSSKIWSDEEAKESFEEVSEYIDILFLNAKYNSKIVIDSNSVSNTVKYIWDKGISTVVIKSTIDKGYYVCYHGNIEFVKFIHENVIDDTGAGDAFNGGFLYGIANGMPPIRSANLASIVAGLQVKNYGAIKSIPSKEDVYKIFKGQNA